MYQRPDRVPVTDMCVRIPNTRAYKTRHAAFNEPCVLLTLTSPSHNYGRFRGLNERTRPVTVTMRRRLVQPKYKYILNNEVYGRRRFKSYTISFFLPLLRAPAFPAFNNKHSMMMELEYCDVLKH